MNLHACTSVAICPGRHAHLRRGAFVKPAAGTEAGVVDGRSQFFSFAQTGLELRHAARVGELARTYAENLAKCAIDLVRAEAEGAGEFGESQGRVGLGGKSGFNFFTDFADERGCVRIRRIGFRAAAPASAKTRALGFDGAIEKDDVLLFWPSGGAGRTAINFGAANGVDKIRSGRSALSHGVPARRRKFSVAVNRFW